MSSTSRSVLFWILAIIITLGAVVYQRIVGPTTPLRGSVRLESGNIRYKLFRSHGEAGDHIVSIKTRKDLEGFVTYKRYKTDDQWTRVPMSNQNKRLEAPLPHQPAGGKLLYQVTLWRSENPSRQIILPENKPTVLRFHDPVPQAIIWPHILLMFFGMLWSNRAGIEALRPGSNPRRLALWTCGLLILGGLVFGPLMQWYSFGAFWTGFPLGYDLTDNKTLIAVIAWVLALTIGNRNPKTARWWILASALITLIIFSIPHSVMGTELDYAAKTGEMGSPPS